MTTIIGVDFSGARTDRNTWITRGRLVSGKSLRLDQPERIRREELHDLLPEVPTPAVAALDFPFGVPRAFAERFVGSPDSATMRTLWDGVGDMTLEQFITARHEFVAANGEPKRSGDLEYHPESYSPLHVVNPNMLPMTYHGIQLLRRWHHARSRRWHVPPMPPDGPIDRRVTLLELMPGALLRSLGLPYKGYKRGRDSTSLRSQILDGLPARAGIALPQLDSVRADCLENDDCLDSVVAAVGAAMWAQDSARFRHPADDELPAALLEGWIYVPEPGRM